MKAISATNARLWVTGLCSGLISLLLTWHLYLEGIAVKPSLLWVLLPPLLLALPGLLRGKLYTYKWFTLLVPFYFTHGVMDAWLPMPIRAVALIEVAISTGLFWLCIAYIKARQAELAEPSQTSESPSP